MNNIREITIGLTGPTGAGKSQAAAVFRAHGCAVADCDKIARSVTAPDSPALPQLAELFGEDIIRADGTLDRRLLAARAFSSEEGKKQLDNITHPHILRLLRVSIAEAHAQGIPVLLDAPLLLETGLDAECSCVIAVLAPVETRIERVMSRDGITREEALRRVSVQHRDEYYASRADYVLLNDGTAEQLADKAQALASDILGNTAVNQYEQVDI